MAAALCLSFVEGILSKLGSSTVPFLGFVFCFNDEKRKLTDELSAIRLLVLDAEKQKEMSHSDEESEDWVGKLRIILYEADDLAEEVSDEAEKQRELDLERNMGDKILCFFKTTLPSIPFYIRMAWELKAIRERLENVAADRAKFPPIAQQGGGNQIGNEETRMEPQAYIRPADIIGREEEKKDIKSMIEHGEVKASDVPTVIAIIGMGGLGKTTLARLVREDAEAFDLKMWVWVSQDFDVKRLLIKVINSATGDECGNLGMDGLQSKLRTLLDGKKYLLVLDDIWTTDFGEWKPFGDLLKSTGAKGSVILATTRETMVASTIGADPKYQYPLKGLERADCLSLFEQQLGSKLDEVEEEHRSIGMDLLNKCGRLPLAILAVAGLLRDPDSDWQNINNDELWSQAQEDNGILPSLRVSYSRLPSNLKKCFAYCSLFHKGDKIQKKTLTQLWLAQGFTDELENSGERCFNELKNRFFLQDIEEDKFGNVISCKMPDLMHDLAKVVAGFEYVTMNGKAIHNSDKIIHASVEGTNVDEGSNARNLMLPTNARNLRTLLIGEEFELYELASSFKHLRVLDLSADRRGRDPKTEVPNSIVELKHLRYFDLSRRAISMLPDFICELRHLQTLKLNHCIHLKELPQDIKKLTSLVHLENEGCENLKSMPVGIGKLTSIQTLPLYVLGGEGSGRLSELENLNNLRGGLCINNLRNARNAPSKSRNAFYLKEKKHLQTLSLEWEIDEHDRERMLVRMDSFRPKDRDDDVALLKSLQPSPYLKELSIRGYSGVEFPHWIGKSLPNLVEIRLSKCQNCECLPLFVDQLPHLKLLSLEDLPELKYIHSYVSNVSSGVAAMFPAFEKVPLSYLPKLKSMPLLPNVEQLELNWSSSGAVIESMTMAETTPTTSSLPSLLTHSKLKSKSIANCSDLVSLPQRWLENLTSLEELSIKDCAKLVSLSLETPHMLKDLKDLAKEDDLQSFTRLRRISLWSLPKLASLPRGLQYATNLEYLDIYRCDGLVSWLDSMGNITSLHSLEIGGLLTLTSLPQALRHLTALEKLCIMDCPELNFSDDDNDTPIPTNLHWLTLNGLPKLTFLPDWLKVLTSLQVLQIHDCEELNSLPETMSCLTALQRLDISKCPQLPETHQRDNISPNIAHIPQILINEEYWQGESSESE